MKKNEQALLPYGLNSNVPVITLPDTDLFKNERGSLAKNYFENKLELLNREYNELVNLAMENEMIYNAQYNFVPRVGVVYHLYDVGDRIILSLIEPNEWDKKHLGSYEYTADSVWQRVDKEDII